MKDNEKRKKTVKNIGKMSTEREKAREREGERELSIHVPLYIMCYSHFFVRNVQHCFPLFQVFLIVYILLLNQIIYWEHCVLDYTWNT